MKTINFNMKEFSAAKAAAAETKAAIEAARKEERAATLAVFDLITIDMLAACLADAITRTQQISTDTATLYLQGTGSTFMTVAHRGDDFMVSFPWDNVGIHAASEDLKKAVDRMLSARTALSRMHDLPYAHVCNSGRALEDSMPSNERTCFGSSYEAPDVRLDIADEQVLHLVARLRKVEFRHMLQGDMVDAWKEVIRPMIPAET